MDLKRLLLLSLLFAAPLLLSACSGKIRCVEPQPYVDAQSFPLLLPVEGLEVPVPDPNMAIADVKGGHVGPYTSDEVDDDVGEFNRCMVAPPAMPSDPL